MTTSSTPTTTILEGNLRELRKGGLADPWDRLHKLPTLLWVARSVSDKSGDLARVKDVLEQGTDRIGQVYGKATKALLGVCAQSYGKDLPTRRMLAYDYFCDAVRRQTVPGQTAKLVAATTFRTHIENIMLRDLAVQLLDLVGEG